jgi:RNA polymerase sigma-70 factor (ECF subfamily)
VIGVAAPSLRLVDGPNLSRAELARAALEHVDALYRLALRLTRSSEDAEDLVQDTYARALGASHQFIAGTNVKAWMFRILRNAHIDIVRRAKAQPLGAAADELGCDVGNEPVRRDLETALASLPVDARTIVLLDLEGFTETEVSMILECPLGTVKSRLARARAALRERLRDYAR